MKSFAILVLTLLISCAHTPSSKVVFAQLPSPPEGTEEVWLTARDSGYLVLDNGCLRIRSVENGRIHTPYWHSVFELVSNEEVISVRSKLTGNTYPVGTYVRVGGGVMDETTARQIDPVAAKKCCPPFASAWIAESQPAL